MILILLTIFLQLELLSSEFITVSTTEPPSSFQKFQKLSDRLSHLEDRLEYTEALKENSRRLQNLENTITSMSAHINSLESVISSCKPTPSKLLPANCQEIKERGEKVSGMYLIQPKYSSDSFMVLCDMETRGGGWAHFLNRFDGSQDFYLNWTDYKNGFGSLSKEFWLGLEPLHQLTGFEANELLVELADWEGTNVYALYNAFAVGSEDEGYPMKVLGKYSGNAGNALIFHAGMKFTTQDRDQDRRPNSNCAKDEKGSWWYEHCTFCNPTARYLRGNVTAANRWQIAYWGPFRGDSYSLKEIRMMVRPRSKHSSSVLPNTK